MTYSTIIADPPWAYDSSRALVGSGGRGHYPGLEHVSQVNVEGKYPTLNLSELKALPVPAAKDAVLFLWTTNPFLCDGSAAEVVKAWGFAPKTVISWLKVKRGEAEPSMKTGHWFRSASEHVIFAVKGKVPRPEAYEALPTWFYHERLPHSVKPTVIHEWAEKLKVPGARLEMFARRAHPGWIVWGNQAPETIELEPDWSDVI